MAIECDKWEWRDLFASKRGPPDPSTRLVLFVILTHIYDGKNSAFPGQDRIAEHTGLSTKSVRRHLNEATKKGWLKRVKNKRRGKVGIWYQYFPTVPWRLRKRMSRPEELSHRIHRPEDVSHRPEDVSHTTGQNGSLDGTGCPPNQVLNKVPKQVLKSEPDRSVVNDFPGVDWAEAIALGKELGVRPPLRADTPKKYMALVKRVRDKRAPAEVTGYIAARVRLDA